MMSAVGDAIVSLSGIAAAIAPATSRSGSASSAGPTPFSGSRPSAGSATPAEGQPADRLAELAQWWAQAGPGGSSVASPERVEELWANGGADPPAPVADALAWGVAAADAAIDSGIELILLTVAASPAPIAALAAYVLDLDAVDVAGWPAAGGMTDVGWMVKVAGIRDRIRKIRGTEPPVGDELLPRLDDAVIAAGAGALVRCASRRTPVILAGDGSAVCALLAWHLNRVALDWVVFADGPVSAAADRRIPGTRDGLHDRMLAAMGAEPLARLGLPWADGTAGRIGLAMLEAALTRAAR